MSKEKQKHEEPEDKGTEELEEEFEIELEELDRLDDQYQEEGEEELLSQEDILQQEIAQLEAKLSEANENFLRLHAEYDNYRKRTTKEKSIIYPEATASAVSQFLPVLDSFERAMEFEHDTKEFKEGFDLIYQNFQDVLNVLHVEEIGKRGEPFNPEVHNAVMHCEEPELPSQSVSMVLQKGYKIGDRVIRHAMVQTAN